MIDLAKVRAEFDEGIRLIRQAQSQLEAAALTLLANPPADPFQDPEEALAAELEAGPVVLEPKIPAARLAPFVAAPGPRPAANPSSTPQRKRPPNTFANRQANIKLAKTEPPAVVRPPRPASAHAPLQPLPPGGPKAPFAPAVANTFLLDGGAIPGAVPVDLHRTQGAPIVKH